jgi:fructose-bisphosphate aldolase class I
VLTVGDGFPTDACIAANAHALARYAALCQEVGLVPIVEPEVLMNGRHELESHYRATARTLAVVFDQLREQRVALASMLLKPNMVLSGDHCPLQASVDEVAEATLRCLRERVPAAVPGIVFLSGGQSPELATQHLDAMNKRAPHPWELSFSYGRALQEPVLKAWRGEPSHIAEAQRQFLLRARLNGAARSGAYLPTMEAAQA